MQHTTPASTPPTPPRRAGTRPALAVGLAFAATIGAVAALAMQGAGGTLDGSPAGNTPPVREVGDIEWGSVDIARTPDTQTFTVEAAVAFDGLDGADATPASPYVLYQLAGGAFDDDEHVDTAAAERTLGMDHEENLLIIPVTGAGSDSSQVPRGTYSPSVDGTISYSRVPPGRYVLKAIVIEPGGSWDGTIATRTVTVD